MDSVSGKSEYYDDVWRFHFVTKFWQRLESHGDKPKKRYSAAGGIYEDDNVLVLSHGADENSKFSNTFSYDLQPASTREWEKIHSGINNYNPSYPHARDQQAGAMISKDKLLLFGGCLR